MLRLRTTREGLGITSTPDSDGQGWPIAESADIPTTLPAVVAANTARSYTAATAHRIAAFGLDFAPIYFDGAIRAVALPTLGPERCDG